MDGGDGAPAPGGGGGGGAPPVGGGGGGGPAPLGAEAAAIVGALGAATQAIQQAIANAAANAAAAAVAAGGAGGGAPGGGGPGPFLRTPLRAGIGQQLDFSTKQGRKYYEQATRSLFSTDEKFDVEPSRFQAPFQVRLPLAAGFFLPFSLVWVAGPFSYSPFLSPS